MVSIIIPILNRHEMTYDCIDAIRRNTIDFELILIDNGSDPFFHPPFVGFTDMTLIRNEENKGFPVAINQGIKSAKGEFIILLNNDVIVTPGWAERLVGCLDEFGIVGPMTNFCAGLQRIDLPLYESIESLNDRAGVLAEEFEGWVEEVNWVIGFCMAFKKSLYDELGPFDETLWPCSGEEIDFCYRARAEGHRVGIAQDVYVHHFGNQTFNDLEHKGQLDYQEICKRNELYLAKKWGPDFWINQMVERIEDGIAVDA